jgi:hypothetical protein
MGPEDDLNISHEDLRTILTRPIAFHRLFADIAGSVGGGVFLSQLYYWSERTDDPHGWIYKTAGEWYDETMLSRRELDSIRKVLKEKGVITEKLAGVPATVHYKIEWNELFYRLKISAQEHREQISESRANQFGGKRQTEQKDKLDRRDTPNQFGGKRQTTLSAEISSENTTENTKTKTAALDLFTNVHPVVVALSSVAREEDSPREISDKLTEEFGLSIPQGREVEAHLASKGAGYVIEKAEIVRNKKAVKNMAGAFMKALSDDWQAPKAIQKPAKQKRPLKQPPQQEPLPTYEQRTAMLAQLKAAL